MSNIVQAARVLMREAEAAAQREVAVGRTQGIQLHFGVVAPKLSKQLGNLVTKKDGQVLDKLAAAVVIVSVHELVPERAAMNARKRICRKAVEMMQAKARAS